MNQDKHTPGPWEIAPGSEYRVMWASRTPEGEIADCGVICDTASNLKTRTRENAANARLIAAAPEMYDALKAMLNSSDFGGVVKVSHPIAIARAAIAKVEG